MMDKDKREKKPSRFNGVNRLSSHKIILAVPAYRDDAALQYRNPRASSPSGHWCRERNLACWRAPRPGQVARACLRDLRCHERTRQGTVGPSLQLCLYETRVVNS